MFHIQTPVLNDKLRSVQREEKKNTVLVSMEANIKVSCFCVDSFLYNIIAVLLGISECGIPYYIYVHSIDSFILQSVL